MSLWKAVLSSAVYVPASCSLSNLKTLAWDLCPGTWCMSAYSSTFVLQSTAAPLSFSTPCARCSSWPMPLVWPQLCSARGLGKQLEAAVLLGGREFILLTGLPTREVAFPQLSFISMALPRAEAMLLIRHNTVAHRTEENSTICTNQCCQGSLEKGKKTYPQCAHYLWLASLNSKIIANLVHWASKKLRNFDSQLEEPVTPKLACYTSIPFMRVSVMAFLNYFEEELTVCRAASKTGSVLNWRVLQYHILN